MEVTKEMVQEKFEERYGKDKEHRTRKQWKNLVATYGFETIVKTEGFTKAEIKEKCKK